MLLLLVLDNFCCLLVWSSVLLLCSFLFCFVSHWLLFIWHFVLFITVRVLFVTVRVVFVAVSCGVCFCLVFVLLFLYGRCCYFVFFGVAVVLVLLSYMILVSSFLFIFLKVLLMFKTAWMCVNGNSWMDVDFFSAVFETNLHVNKTKIIFVFWASCCLGFFT